MALSNESPAFAFFGISVACLIISQFLAYVTSLPGEWPGIVSNCCLMAIGIQCLMCVPSAILATEKYFDMTGSFAYIFLALYSLFRGGTFHFRQILVTSFVVIWAVRLGAFLHLRIQRAGKDGRFDEIKNNIPRFFNMWTIQGLWVVLTELPVFCLNATEENVVFPMWSDYLGMVCFGFGLALEVIADQQKTEFALNPDNEGKWISTGLWAFSRHPNYFGEIVLWIGIFLIAATTFSDGQWACIESPIFVAFLLVKVSGIPLLEARADEKWGEDEQYQAYKERTPVLIPFPSLESFESRTQTGGASDLSESLITSEDADQQPIVEIDEQK
jgi:steroid 5-alpha reductase family enzyme